MTRLSAACWAGALPAAVRTALIATAPGDALLAALDERNIRWSAGDSAEGTPADAIVVPGAARPSNGIEAAAAFLGCLAVDGRVLVEAHAPEADPALNGAMARHGLAPYVLVMEEGATPATRGVLALVRAGYDPCAHARRLMGAGQPGAALELLEGVPDTFRSTDAQRLQAAMHTQLCLYQLAEGAGGRERLHHFVHAQKQLTVAVNTDPMQPLPFAVQARFCRLIGRPDLGARLVRTIQHANPAAGLHSLADELAGDTGPVRQHPAPLPDLEDGVPPRRLTRGEDRPPRFLLLSYPGYDYGADLLYAGLRRLYGDDAIVEYPWKPTLHGRDYETADNYPCTFDLPGRPVSAADLEARLRAGGFDAVLWANMLALGDLGAHRRLIEAGREVPLFVLDTWDNCSDLRDRACALMGREGFAAYFKREKLAGYDYGPRSFPLPYGYDAGRAAAEPPGPRPEGLFWAGNRHFSIRRLYLEHLERGTGQDLSRRYDPEAYRRAAGQARVGLDLFGFGFDTVRYWELPALGCLLLAERRPIELPFDFVDGRHALLFEDLAELEDRLAWCGAHADAVTELARAGYAHFHRHHTESARARQFVAMAEAALASREQG